MGRNILAAILGSSLFLSTSAGPHVDIYGWHGCPDTTMYFSRYAQFMLDAAEESGADFTLLWRSDTHPRTEMQDIFLPYVACASHVQTSDLAWLGVVGCLNPGLSATPGLQECEAIAGMQAADSELIAQCTRDDELSASLVDAMAAAVSRSVAAGSVHAFPWVVVDGRAIPEPDVPLDGHGWGEGTEDDVMPLGLDLCGTKTSPACSRLQSVQRLPARVPVVITAWHGCSDTTLFLERLQRDGVEKGLTQVANLTILYRSGTHPHTDLQPDFLPFVACAQRQYPPGSVYDSLLGIDQSPAWYRVAACAQDGTTSLTECAEREKMPVFERVAIQACMDDDFLADTFVAARDADHFGAVTSFPWATVDGEAVPEPDINGDDPTPLIRRICEVADPRLPRPDACRVSPGPLAVLLI